MPTLDLDEAQSHLREVVVGLQPGEEVVLTDNGQPLAKLVKTARTSWPCKAGSAKDIIHWMAVDFNAPLDEFTRDMERRSCAAPVTQLEVAMIELTEEQRQLLDTHCEGVPRLLDPRTQETYVLVREAVFTSLQGTLQPQDALAQHWQVPPGVRHSQEALWRELPALLRAKRNHRKWVAYHREERIGTAGTKAALIVKCRQRGLKPDEYYIAVIRPLDGPPWELQELDPSGWEITDTPPDASRRPA